MGTELEFLRSALAARGAALAGIVGGLLWSAVFLMSLFNPPSPDTDTPDGAFRVAFFASPPLLLVAARAAQRRQEWDGGVLGWVGYALVQAALGLATLFLVLWGLDGSYVAYYAYFFLLPVGSVMFAVALLRSGVLPAGGAILVGI